MELGALSEIKIFNPKSGAWFLLNLVLEVFVLSLSPLHHYQAVTNLPFVT